jgi:hypothetical protein
MTTYRVGKLTDPRPDDVTVADWQAALAAAHALMDASDWDTYVVAIWKGDDGAIAALCWQGQVFCA